MKNYLFIVLIGFLGFSCSEVETPEIIAAHDIIGNWDYKKEVTSTLFEQPSIPKYGSIFFNDDNTGGKSMAHTSVFTFKWNFENEEQNINIVEDNWAIPAEGTSTYEINHVDKYNFIFTYRWSLGEEDYSEEVMTLTRAE